MLVNFREQVNIEAKSIGAYISA